MAEIQDLATIYTENRAFLVGFIDRMVRNKAVAEDLMQETFLQVTRKLHEFRGESKVRSWICRIAVRIVCDHFRKNDPTVPLDDGMEGMAKSELAIPDQQQQGVVNRVTIAKLMQRHLTATQRRAILMHYFEGYSFNEIESMTGRRRAAIMAALRGRARLRKVLLRSRKCS